MQTTDTQEILRTIGELKSETCSALSVLETKVDGINRRLDLSNGRITSNEESIRDLEIQESEILVRLSVLQAEWEDRIADQRRYRVAMLERLLWLGAAIVLAIVVKYLNL